MAYGEFVAVTSVGAALFIIDGTGLISEDGTWGENMHFTESAIEEVGKVNGPRCCKRDAMISFKHAINYINCHYFDADWQIQDPTGKDEDTFIEVIKEIEMKVKAL